jgi:hypothetical protein
MRRRRLALARIVTDPAALADAPALMGWLSNPVPAAAADVVTALRTHVESLPEPSMETRPRNI